MNRWFFRRCDDHVFGSFVQNEEVKPLIPDPNLDRKPTNGSERNADSLPSNRTDEQALLTTILQRTALYDTLYLWLLSFITVCLPFGLFAVSILKLTFLVLLVRNIIDVSAVISQGLEQHEYMDRARQYRCVTLKYH